LRELNFCRNRLGDLQKNLQLSDADEFLAEELVTQRSLFPFNGRSLPEATEKILETITPDDVQDLDHRMQEVLRKQFTTLAHVCLSSANLTQNLQQAMQRAAELYLLARLESTSVCEMFFERHESGTQAADDLAALFEEAKPELANSRISSQ